MSLVRLLDCAHPNFTAEVNSLRGVLRGGALTARSELQSVDVPAIVSEIIADVAARGDCAVTELTSKYDRVSLTDETLRVPTETLELARANCDPDFWP